MREKVAADASAPRAGRARSLHKWHPGGLHWEPAIMLAPGHREALSSWRLIPDFLLPGLEFKVNSCICKLIRLLKKTQEWKINGSVCFSPLLQLFHLPCSKVLLWPSGCGWRGWWQLARKARHWGVERRRKRGGREKRFVIKASFEALYDLAHSWYALSLK